MTKIKEAEANVMSALFKLALFDDYNSKFGCDAMMGLIDAVTAFDDAVHASNGEFTTEDMGDALSELMQSKSLSSIRNEILELIHYDSI